MEKVQECFASTVGKTGRLVFIYKWHSILATGQSKFEPIHFQLWPQVGVFFAVIEVFESA
jgi:hypothetical protein